MTETRTRYKPRQRPATPARMPFPLPERLQRMFDRGMAEIAQPFKGITTDGTVRPGLFALQRTGLSLQPVVDAAQRFLASLTLEQRTEGVFDIDSPAWRQWSNIHPYLMRHGLRLEALTPEQRGLALEVVQSCLSTAGFTLARDIMRLNEYIRELTGKDQDFGEWLYWISLMGTPSMDQPWGWQIDGHHLILNAFIIGDQLVLTPAFMGSEPVEADSGPYRGTRVLAAEEAGGLALMSALDPTQRQRATIGAELPDDVLAAAFRDNLELPYAGLRYDDMTAGQQKLLHDLIRTYVGRIRPGHAEVRLAEVEARLKETHFAWIGCCDDRSPFYYRIQSPVILVEFDHQPGIALSGEGHTRDHVHTLVRTPNGNDYGRDLLRQHYASFDHANPLSPHRRGEV